MLLEGVARARVTRYAPNDSHLRATLSPMPFERSESVMDDNAMARRVTSLFEEYVGLHRRLPPEVVSLVQGSEARDRQAFAVSAHLLVRVDQRQQLLESASTSALLERLSALLTAEIEILRLERKIENDVRGSLFQNQREFYLQEQLKAIHRELGQEDGDDFDELAASIAAKSLPQAVRERAERELRKLRRTPPLSPESTIAKFLDRSGPGLQQLAYRVADIDAVCATLRERGLRLLYDEPKRGTSDSRVNFIHPKDAGGVLVELVEPAASH